MDNYDQIVIQNIKAYIDKNNLALGKIAKASGISYHRLWCLFNKRGSINLGDYVALCRAFKEDLVYFLPK